MAKTVIRYRPQDQDGLAPKVLVANHGAPEQRSLMFYDRVEIGRDPQVPNFQSGKILVGDQAVSGRHCVVTQKPDGRCFVRDVSRNGTRIDGRRLVPGIETEIFPGQVLSIGQEAEFYFDEGAEPESGEDTESIAGGATMAVKLAPIDVTILVGDIHSYTKLSQSAPARQLQESVARVFAELEKSIRQHGGMLKEYQGDAIFCYWESGPNPNHAADACRAALELRSLVQRLAVDEAVWDVPGFDLGMDWSLASGKVVIETIGGETPTGLSMIGEAVVLAFRLEKLAAAEGGGIVASGSTRELVQSDFEFRDEGTATVAGFEEPQRYFSLLSEASGETSSGEADGPAPV